METVSVSGCISERGHDGDDLREPRPIERRSRHKFVAAILAVLALGSVLFWIYVLFIAPPAPEDKLNDATFPSAAQPICMSAITDLSAANLLNQHASSPQQRADIVEPTDARLATMVHSLRAITPPNADDAHAVSGWLDDWDQWLHDRAAWVVKLRAGQDAPFDEKARGNGEPNSKALNAFAVTNEMGACATPYGT